jgi:hypothetical protein
VFLFGLLLINLVTVIANPCAGIVGRLYVQADSCNTYFLCENSVATKMACPIGFLFDFEYEQQACDDPDHIVCVPNNAPTVPLTPPTVQPTPPLQQQRLQRLQREQQLVLLDLV